MVGLGQDADGVDAGPFVAGRDLAGVEVSCDQPDRRRGAFDLADDRGSVRRAQRLREAAPFGASPFGALGQRGVILASFFFPQDLRLGGIEALQNVIHGYANSISVEPSTRRASKTDWAAPLASERRACSSPSFSDPACSATTSASAAFNATTSARGEFSPPKIARSVAAFSIGAPPARSTEVARIPNSAGSIRYRRLFPEAN